jgi:ribosomal protein S26
MYIHLFVCLFVQFPSSIIWVVKDLQIQNLCNSLMFDVVNVNKIFSNFRLATFYQQLQLQISNGTHFHVLKYRNITVMKKLEEIYMR